MKLEPYHVYTQNLIQNGLGLNIRLETIKLLEENMGAVLPDIVLGNEYLDLTLKPQATNAKTDKWKLIKLKSFFTAMEKKRVQKQIQSGRDFL